ASTRCPAASSTCSWVVIALPFPCFERLLRESLAIHRASPRSERRVRVCCHSGNGSINTPGARHAHPGREERFSVKPVPVGPSPDRPRIGARLRAARQRQGLNIEPVAAAAEVTKGFVSRVERDETSPSVATLVTLCEVLSLPVGTLFEVAETALIRRAEAPQIHLTGDGAAESLVPPRGQARLQMIRS